MDLQECSCPCSHGLSWAWLAGIIVLGICSFVYWALDFYLLEAVLGASNIYVEWDRESPVTRLVEKHCKTLTLGRYQSTPLLCSPNVQTAYLHLDPFSPSVKYRREIVIQRDGGSVGLDWAGTDKPETPIIIIVPGVTSDSTASYVRHLVATVYQRGWRAVVLNHRGLGGVSLTSDATHNAEWTTDIREVLATLQTRFPSALLALAGASLGAGMVIRYLGEEGDKTPVKGAFTIGSPYDLLVVERYSSRKFIQKVWNHFITLGLKEYVHFNRAEFGKVVDQEHLMAFKTVHQFCDKIVRVTGKYETADAYYRQSSCAPWVTSVRAPLLTMSALDDPICTRESIPWDECHLNPNVVLATAARGGHLAGYEGWLPTKLWWTTPGLDFLGALFNENGLSQNGA